MVHLLAKRIAEHTGLVGRDRPILDRPQGEMSHHLDDGGAHASYAFTELW